MSRYETRIGSATTTSSGATHTYVASVTIVKVSWWKRLWRRVKR